MFSDTYNLLMTILRYCEKLKIYYLSKYFIKLGDNFDIFILVIIMV